MKPLKFVSSGFILLVSIIFFTVGLGALLAPETVMSYLDVEAVTDSAKNSIRSAYGGMNLAIGLFLFYGAAYLRKTSLALISLYMIGFLIGRVFSFIADGFTANLFVINWTVVEIILLVVSSVLFKSMLKTNNTDSSLNATA